MALSTLRKLLAARALRTGYGIEDLRIKGIESRRRERVFGADGPGRSSRLAAGVKLEKMDDKYDPRTDTCVRAYVRLRGVQVRARAGEDGDEREMCDAEE